MRNFACRFLLSVCALSVAPALVRAGGDGVERREFKQSTSYPYVFRPVCYLATSGPVAMRFAVPAPECGDRRAPKLPPAAKNTPKPEPAPAPAAPAPPAAPEPAPAQVSAATANPAPAYPPPENAPRPKPPTVDFSQFPVELVEAFKRGREGMEARNYLFDPIFQPALPEDLPRSKAAYREK